ncbi:hypothetical protein [Streptomyces erythrochromogenes]|uniref:hypothetical protein n=1 Tax=Streptomyces erythrochromogenes TaxID=285574 RepID=UPI0033E68DDD
MGTDDADEVLTVALDWDDLDTPYTRDVTRRQLGELLLRLDDMAGDTSERTGH